MSLKTKYKYIHFELAPKYFYIKKKTKIWYCISNNGKGLLGIIKWFGRWRQYCFFPTNEIIFNTGCMIDIIDFIKQINKEHKAKNVSFNNPVKGLSLTLYPIKR